MKLIVSMDTDTDNNRVNIQVPILDENGEPVELLLSVTFQGLVLDVMNEAGEFTKTACMGFDDLYDMCK